MVCLYNARHEMPLFMLQLFVSRTAPRATKIKLAEEIHPPLREWK